MKYLLFITTFLVGCQSVPVKQTMPELPREFPPACGQLKMLEGNKVVLSKLMETVANNYITHHECAAYYENLYQWYNKQKDIFNRANN